MFPRGGIHWNAIGSTLGTQKLIAAINAQREEPLLAEPRLHLEDVVQSARQRSRSARHHEPAPSGRTLCGAGAHLSSAPPPGGCHTVAITEVGGSFLHGLNSGLLKLACPPTITEWFYWDQRRIHQVGGRVYELPIDAEARRRSLVEADVVILEENESIAPGSKHATMMMDDLQTLAGRTP